MRLEVRDDLGRLLHARRRPRPARRRSSTASTTSWASGRSSRRPSWRASGSSISSGPSRSWWCSASGGSKEYQGAHVVRGPAALPGRAPAAPAARAGHGQRLHLGREGQRQPGGAARLVRRLLVRPRPHDPRGPGAGDPRVRAHGRLRLAPVPDQEGALQAHRRQEVPGAQPEPRRSRGAAHPGRRRRTAARNKAVYNMDYYFVGDEGSLTSYADPVDFCFGPHTLANFRRWLQGAVRLARGLESHVAERLRGLGRGQCPRPPRKPARAGVFPPWADHRTYMEVSFANAYQVVRDAVVEGRPRGAHRASRGPRSRRPGTAPTGRGSTG